MVYPAEPVRLFFFKLIVVLLIPYATCQSQDWNTAYPYIQDSSSFSEGSSFDFIIVGGGTAGCPLAATLSHGASVLLLERGGVPYDQPAVHRVEGFPCVLGSRATQQFQSLDGVMNRRAKVLGGGSSVNAGFYSRASLDFISEQQWDPQRVALSFSWVERRIVFQPQPGAWQAALRDGMLEAGLGPYVGPTYEHVTGVKLGNTLFDSNGTRHTAADLLSDGNHANLTVLIYATVERVLFAPTPSAPPSALGVSFLSSQGLRHIALLKPGGEVILAAGALGSPQLLLLSGLGPRHKLQAIGVQQVADIPFVGENITDIPINAINVLSARPVEESSLQFAAITAEGNIIEGASGGNHTTCWPEGGEINTVPPANRTAVMEAVAGATFGLSPPFITDALNQAGFILSKVYLPKSRGTLWLNSRNVTDNPIVRYNYYSDPDDIATCVNGAKRLQAIISSTAFASFRYTSVPLPLLLLQPSLLSTPAGQFGGSLPLLPDTSNFTAAAQWCKDTVSVIWHFHGGCRRGLCVDAGYHVQGVNALRVIDGSTWSRSPGTNPMATCLMLGRYMGLEILQERGVDISNI